MRARWSGTPGPRRRSAPARRPPRDGRPLRARPRRCSPRQRHLRGPRADPILRGFPQRGGRRAAGRRSRRGREEPARGVPRARGDGREGVPLDDGGASRRAIFAQGRDEEAGRSRSSARSSPPGRPAYAGRLARRAREGAGTAGASTRPKTSRGRRWRSASRPTSSTPGRTLSSISPTSIAGGPLGRRRTAAAKGLFYEQKGNGSLPADRAHLAVLQKRETIAARGCRFLEFDLHEPLRLGRMVVPGTQLRQGPNSFQPLKLKVTGTFDTHSEVIGDVIIRILVIPEGHTASMTNPMVGDADMTTPEHH